MVAARRAKSIEPRQPPEPIATYWRGEASTRRALPCHGSARDRIRVDSLTFHLPATAVGPQPSLRSPEMSASGLDAILKVKDSGARRDRAIIEAKTERMAFTVLKVRELAGPNIWRAAPVIEARLSLQFLDRLAETARSVYVRLDSAVELVWPVGAEAMAEESSGSGVALSSLPCSHGRLAIVSRAWREGASSLSTQPQQLCDAVISIGTRFARTAQRFQAIIGRGGSFYAARLAPDFGELFVAIDSPAEELAESALEAAAGLFNAALEGGAFDRPAAFRKLLAVARQCSPSPAAAALWSEAQRRGIPCQRLGRNGLMQLGQGARSRRVLGLQTDHIGAVAASVASDKEYLRDLMSSYGFPTPRSRRATSKAEAVRFAEQFGFPVVLRPARDVPAHNGVARNLATEAQLLEAFSRLSQGSVDLLVEKQIPGDMFRLFVSGSRLVAAVQLSALSVPSRPARPQDGDAAGHASPISGHSRLRDVASLVHRDTAVAAFDASRLAGLDFAAVDIVAQDIAQPLARQQGAIVDVSSMPDLPDSVPGAVELLRPVAHSALDSIFPEGRTGRIPIVAVTGVNGKTTTTRLVAHILGACGHTVGMTCTEGVYIGGRRTEAGDCSGPQSARSVLSHPRVDAAALEAARGGILRAGLGFDRCDVAVVTNIGEGDHLGLAGIETPAQLAEVKRTLVEAVDPLGAAVLKADDPLVAAMAPYCPGAVVYFCRAADHPLLSQRRQQGGRVAFVRDGAIVLAEGETEFTLLSLDRIPLTHRGRIGFQVENALAGTAAAWALGKPCELIRLGLETFSAGIDDLPGRFNLLEFNGAAVIVDYGHNASSLAALVEALAHFPHHRRSAVYSAAGDRRDCDFIRQGEVLGEAFDKVILFEDNYRRGRAPGEIIELFRQGLASGRRVRQVLEMHGWRKAVELAMASLEPGDLLVVQADEVDDAVAFLRRRLSEDPAIREVDLEHALRPPKRHPAKAPV